MISNSSLIHPEYRSARIGVAGCGIELSRSEEAQLSGARAIYHLSMREISVRECAVPRLPVTGESSENNIFVSELPLSEPRRNANGKSFGFAFLLGIIPLSSPGEEKITRTMESSLTPTHHLMSSSRHAQAFQSTLWQFRGQVCTISHAPSNLCAADATPLSLPRPHTHHHRHLRFSSLTHSPPSV